MGYKRPAKKTAKKRVPWYRKKYSAMEVAMKALKATKYMKGMINCEKKYHDFIQNTTCDNGGFTSCLTNIAQGDTDSTRDGNSILGRSIYIQGNIIMGTGVSTQSFRLIVFQDKQNLTSGTGYATPSDILEVTGTANAPISPLNRDINNRLKIIRDFKFTLNSANYPVKKFNEYIKIYCHPKFDGPSSAEFDRDHIYWMIVSENATGVNLPTVNLYCRFGFYDN